MSIVQKLKSDACFNNYKILKSTEKDHPYSVTSTFRVHRASVASTFRVHRAMIKFLFGELETEV